MSSTRLRGKSGSWEARIISIGGMYKQQVDSARPMIVRKIPSGRSLFSNTPDVQLRVCAVRAVSKIKTLSY